MGCFSLTNVTLPSKVTAIGDGLFWFCGSLSSVTLGDNVTSIGARAFSGCGSLTGVAIPGSVNSIGENAFEGCTNLTGMGIPNGVTNIGAQAFTNCTRLASVTIGTGVTSIGDDAFAGCRGLTSAYFQGNAPAVGSDVFDYDGEAVVYYLPGTTGWGPTFGGCPTAPWSLPNPVILSFEPDFGVQSNGFGFTVSWATGACVVVEVSSNLGTDSWSPVQTNALVNGSAYFNNPGWTNVPAGFYRLRWP